LTTSTLDKSTQTSPEATAVVETERRIDLKILSCLLGASLLLVSFVSHALFASDLHGSVLAMVASILLGAPIVLDALRGLLRDDAPRPEGTLDSADRSHGTSGMGELVALAVIASFASRQYLECGSIAFFMLIASFIEDRTAVGARKTIESLIRLTPTRAVRMNAEGDEVDVDARDLLPGDVVVVRPGDNIPADGTVENGTSTVEEANITGESLPAEKTAGDDVFGGTINQTGAMRIRVTRAGDESTLGRVQKLILEASASRPAVVRMLDRYAGYYTPVVLMVAGVVLFFTRDIDSAVSLLLIACPAAIVLSGPTAIVAALSAAARLGVLIKNVADLETARRVTAVVFDKTGTLTTGKLGVTRMRPAPDVDGADLLRLCAAVERDSKHPVARAVRAAAESARVDVPQASEFEETAGRGVAAIVDGDPILVGRRSWIEERDVSTTEFDEADTDGLSLLWVARAGRVIGWIGLEDTTRDDAADTIRDLERLGVRRRVLVTGDRASPAQRVANDIAQSGVSLSHVEAEALPARKLELVDDLKERGHTVAVIGDGVNDGPALAAGHISIAMGAAGSDVAIHSASIALMNNRLDRIPFLLRLSARTVAVVRQNLIGVGLFVVGMLVLLGCGQVTPLVAALAQGLSSIVVVFNSARLVREGEDLTEAKTGVEDAS